MKKWLSMILTLVILFGMCACGRTSQTADGLQAAESEEAAIEETQEDIAEAVTAEASVAEEVEEEPAEPEPEPVYVLKPKAVVLSKTVNGQSLPLNNARIDGRIFDLKTEYVYDEFGEIAEERESLEYPANIRVFSGDDGKEFDNYTYVYGEDGSLQKVTTTAYMNYGGLSTGHIYTFEDGHVVLDQEAILPNGSVVEETKYEYGDNGQVVREEDTTYAYLISGQWLSTPVVQVYEYDENGYCTHWTRTEGVSVFDCFYSWDADGNLTRLEMHRSEEDAADVMNMQYENGNLISTTRENADGTIVYSFAYDEEGRPVSTIYDTTDGHHIDLLYSYNEEGYLSEVDWQKNGNTEAKTTYTYTTEDDGSVRVSVIGDQGMRVFGRGVIEGQVFDADWLNSDGTVDRSYDYELKGCLNAIAYYETETTYEYGTIQMKVEADPTTVRSDLSVEIFEPELRESYGGYPVPAPDGSQRLVGLTRGAYSGAVIVKSELMYDSEGKLVSISDYFDPVASYKTMKQYFSEDQFQIEADELGRVSRRIYHPGQTDEAVTEFIYPDDSTKPTTYRTIFTNSEETEEEVISIEDYHAVDEFGKTLEELMPDTEFEFNEDGLVVHANGFYSDGEAYSRDYTYEYYADENGYLNSGWSNWGFRIRFDEHGYLTEYALAPSSAYMYEFEYMPIE